MIGALGVGFRMTIVLSFLGEEGNIQRVVVRNEAHDLRGIGFRLDGFRAAGRNPKVVGVGEVALFHFLAEMGNGPAGDAVVDSVMHFYQGGIGWPGCMLG